MTFALSPVAGGMRVQIVHSGFVAPINPPFAAMPEFAAVHAASLDEPERFTPAMLTYRVRAYAWDAMDPALAAFDRMPPG